jgi:DNA-binding PadR family transcriptional regulator
MSLDYAILGFLNYSAMSGYDLKKVFDVSVQHFWPADQSQIYRTLGRLEGKQWVKVETVRQKVRPDRKVYHITDVGRKELRRWLIAALPPAEFRDPAQIQVFFAGQLKDREILEMFERMASKLREELAQYEKIPIASAPFRDVGMPRENFFWMLTLESGMSAARAQLRWVESVIRRIRNRKVPAR